MRKNSLDHSNSTEEIGVELCVDFFFCAFLNGTAKTITGVVDETSILPNFSIAAFTVASIVSFFVTSNLRHKAVRG